MCKSNQKDIEQEIMRQESFINEEQRCLDYCRNNPDECEKEEIDKRTEDVAKLIDKLEKFKIRVNYDNKENN